MEDTATAGKEKQTALLAGGDQQPGADEETAQKKLKYPKSVFFIVSNEFCERFSYYGMRTILAIYLRNVLQYSDDAATVIYHTFTMFCYFFPLFGAMLADSLLGKFRTILYVSIVYAVGNIVISIASATGALDLPAREVSILGLLLIAVGTGGIKPCVSAFGGDQFVLPQQEKQLQKFFSLFYFSINAGSLISTFLTPVLRQDVKCLDQDTCYPLAFGVPAVLMIVSIFIFLFGKRMYVIKKPEGNVVLEVSKCITHAIGNKYKTKQPREHWLDHADDKYSKTLIDDIKATLRVLFLYLPLPIFWALFDQQGSRWTFQATRMNGDLGGYSLKPDQMQVVNPLLILAFIPIFETVIYPLLSRCNLLVKPLQRLGVGGVLAATSFIISAIIEIQLEPTYAVLPKTGEGQIRIFNGLNCPVNVTLDKNLTQIEPLGFWKNIDIAVSGEKTFEARFVANCNEGVKEAKPIIKAIEEQAVSYFITADNGTLDAVLLINGTKYDNIDKSNSGDPTLRVVYKPSPNQNKTLYLKQVNGEKIQDFILDADNHKTEEGRKVDPSIYQIELEGKLLEGEVKLELGGVYTLLLSDDYQSFKLHTISVPNSFHMLWLIPQYVVITMGEVMFSITGLEFSFTQAPVSMKSVMQACWLLTVAFGNLIVVIIAEAKFFDSQTYEFFLFAGLMLVDMGVFALMAMRYKYVEPINYSGEEENGIALESTSKEKNGIENKTYIDDEQH